MATPQQAGVRAVRQQQPDDVPGTLHGDGRSERPRLPGAPGPDHELRRPNISVVTRVPFPLPQHLPGTSSSPFRMDCVWGLGGPPTEKMFSKHSSFLMGNRKGK